MQFPYELRPPPRDIVLPQHPPLKIVSATWQSSWEMCGSTLPPTSPPPGAAAPPFFSNDSRWLGGQWNGPGQRPLCVCSCPNGFGGMAHRCMGHAPEEMVMWLSCLLLSARGRACAAQHQQWPHAPMSEAMILSCQVRTDPSPRGRSHYNRPTRSRGSAVIAHDA